MPPRKKSLPKESTLTGDIQRPVTREIHNSNVQSNKRASDTPLPDSGKRRKHADVNNKELRRDSYCWVCHQFGHDIQCKRDKCQRVYHTDCLNKQFKFIDGVCPECQQLKSKNKFLTVDNLRDILEVAVKEFRKKFKSPDKMLFFQWPNIESSELVRIIDLDYLEDNIKDIQNPYKSLAGFISDVKWIHHNFCILDGVDSSTAKEAEGFVRTFQKEVFDIEDCPMCYYNMLVPNEGRRGNFFLKICDPPHDIVWAKLKGSPHWPAKCLRVVNGKAHVRFFSTHDKSNIPIDKKKCFAISMHHPEHRSSRITDDNLIPKKMEYKEAVEELLDYIKLYERKFGKKFKFHMVGTPYKYEPPKPIRKKRKMDHHSVSLSENSEESIHIPPPPFGGDSNSTRDLTENEDSSVPSAEIDANHSTGQENESQNVLNEQIDEVEDSSGVLKEQTGNQSLESEEGIHTSEENTDRTEFVAMDSSLFERPNMIDASTSPVLSASMICEVAGCSDAQTSYIHPLPAQVDFSQLNLSPGTSVATTTFQPFISCTSTPVVTASSSVNNFSNQWGMALSRAHNLMSKSATPFQDALSQHLVSDTEELATDSDENESIPIHIAPSTSARNPNEDDDVIYIRSSRPTSDSGLKPTNSLPYIFGGSPDLKALFKEGKFVFDSLFVRCWAYANRCPQAPEIIASLIVQMKKLHLDKIRLLKDKKALNQNKSLEEGRVYREEYAKLQENNNKLRTELHDMTIELEETKAENAALTNNAQVLVEKLHKQYQKVLAIEEREMLLEREKMLRQRDSKINAMYDLISKLKGDINVLNTKHAETVTNYSSKLEEMLKTQKETVSQETKQEIKDLIGQHFNEIKLSLKPERSSSGNHERNMSLVSIDERSSSVKKSTRRSPPKAERFYHRLPIEAETTAATINQQFYQQQEIQTVARKTSVSVQLERTMKTTTTTRNEGKLFGYSPPIYGRPFDPSTSAGHPPYTLPHIPLHDIRSSSLLSNQHVRETHARETHARETHARETHAREIHARETHARETHARESHIKETKTKKSRFAD